MRKYREAAERSGAKQLLPRQALVAESSIERTLQPLACIINENLASGLPVIVNTGAKQVALSPEKRDQPRAEGDRVRCDALLALASNRQSDILGLAINSLQTLNPGVA